MKAYFYCDPRSLNDATSYYVNLVMHQLEKYGYEFSVVHSLRMVSRPDLILTITGKYFFKAKCRFPFCKTVFWAQGVSAAEAKMSIRNLVTLFRYLSRAITEPFAISRSDVLFCVSEKMVEYYQATYHFQNVSKCIIMPCYNLNLSNSFNESQYESPSFVYAGGCDVWQGVDFMLDVFAKLEKLLKGSKLTVLTSQQEAFDGKIKERGIVNYKVRYVPLTELQNELHKHKYGFIIREDNIVNNVATPTKMNSYLSNFIIPIYSNAVDSFIRHINLEPFRLMISCPLSVDDAVDQILAFENRHRDFSRYYKVVKDVFDSYYNDTVYQQKMDGVFKKQLLGVG